MTVTDAGERRLRGLALWYEYAEWCSTHCFACGAAVEDPDYDAPCPRDSAGAHFEHMPALRPTMEAMT